MTRLRLEMLYLFSRRWFHSKPPLTNYDDSEWWYRMLSLETSSKEFRFCDEFIHRCIGMARCARPNKSIEMMLTQWRICTLYTVAQCGLFDLSIFTWHCLRHWSSIRTYKMHRSSSRAMQRKQNENDLCTRMWIETSGKLHAMNSHVPKRPRGKYANKLLRDSAATQFRFDAIPLYSSIHFPLLLCCFAIEMRLNKSHVSGAGLMWLCMSGERCKNIFAKPATMTTFTHRMYSTLY